MLFLKIISNLLGNILAYGKSQYMQARVQVKNKTCKFYPGVRTSNTSFGNYNVIFNDCVINSSTIGSHTYIQKKSTIFNCTIGKFCSIATQVSIAPGVHHIYGVSTHPAFYLHNTPLVKKYSATDLFEPFKRVVIGADVWLGERAVVLDGVTIGTGAIIAAGAIVTKDVEPYAIVGGCPAKFIKYRFDEQTREALLKSEWWEKDENWLAANHQKFNNPVELLNLISDDHKIH